MDIKQDIQNKLLKRQELVLETESETNPNFSDLKKQIAEKTSKPEENIDVYSIKGSFGKNKFKIKANIYDSKQDLEDVKKLELTKKQRKENAKPAEEKPEETPVDTDNITSEEPGQASENTPTEKPADSAPVEDKPEQAQENSEQKPTEAPVEERPEQEQKAVKEEKQAEQEAKEP